jgi:hypothetical protein
MWIEERTDGRMQWREGQNGYRTAGGTNGRTDGRKERRKKTSSKKNGTMGADPFLPIDIPPPSPPIARRYEIEGDGEWIEGDIDLLHQDLDLIEGFRYPEVVPFLSFSRGLALLPSPFASAAFHCRHCCLLRGSSKRGRGK